MLKFDFLKKGLGISWEQKELLKWDRKTLKGHSGTRLKCSFSIDNDFVKLSTYSLFKNMSKAPISDLNERGFSFKFCLIFIGPPF